MYIYFGSDAFSLEVLKGLAKVTKPLAVVTQPDRPQGRKQKITQGPLAAFATEQAIPLVQPENLKTQEAQDAALAFDAKLMIVVSFGQILPKSFLARCPDIINGHASLLPKLRGASPIQSAILHGHTESGMTIMHIVQALDAGPMIAKKAFRLDANETHGSLSDKLIADAIELLLPFATGKKAVPAGEEQDHDASTHCGKLHKQDCRLDPITMDIDSLDRIIRAFYPMPGAFVRIKTAKGEKSLKLLSLGDKPDPEATSHDSTPGLHRTEKLMWITDKNGASRTVVDVQMEGKPAMPAPQFLNGFRGELELA